MKNKAFAPLALFCCLFGALWAQKPSANQQPMNGPWKDIQELRLPKPGQEDVQLPEKFRLLELDLDQLTTMLSKVPANFSKNIAGKPRLEIEIPLPDGSNEKFVVYSDPIMHPDLAKQFPEIQTFAGHGIDDPTATIRMDLSPHGFSAQILSGKKGSIYLAPVARGDNRHNISYFKKDSKRSGDWKCSTHEDEIQDALKVTHNQEFAGDCGILHEYRLALACSGEYAAHHGGTVALALAAMNTTMNRVNGVFERDCSIRMVMVANNNLIVFTNAMTDPYTNQSSGPTSISENQTVVDMLIGSANYDIGHVFTTGSGGLAPGNTCSGSKAMATTGQAVPEGDAFDIDYVAHEMGHQFNANHTQYNDGCNRWNPTAIEPGSASTIMGYAGVNGCAPFVAFNSDDYFHTVSVFEIRNYVATGAGNTCDNALAVANNAPNVAPVANYSIPVSTPFVLTAAANDPDGNALTYCWEQIDAHTGTTQTMPPAPGNTSGPMFRSFDPTPSPRRYFPALADILSNTNSDWEELPSIGRVMNFRVTVRDNFVGGGCTEETASTVTTIATAGPFTVTSIGVDPNCLLAEANTSITWNVANTNAAPINCTQVDIWLSLDGGNTFTIQLANNALNDGSQVVAIPATAITAQGRIMVMASDNIFFDVNDNDISINCPANTTVTANPVSGVVKVREKIETAGPVVVLPATSARFYAGESIRLKPGFWAQRGSDFQAKIKPCDACTSTRPASLAAEKGNPNVYFYELPSNERTKAYAQSPLNAFAFPNPFDQNFTVSFDLLTAGKVDIQLMDLTGRLIQNVYQNDFLEAGTHQIPVTTGQLAAGVYGCRVSSNGQQAQIKLVKIN